MATKKQKFRNRWIAIALFFVFSLVLFINNMTDLFIKFGIKIPIMYVTWIGLIGTWVYTIYLASEDKL